MEVSEKTNLPDLDCRFTYHKPKDDQVGRYSLIRATAKDFAYLIVEATPESREQSLAITKLEEAVFWANAAIARRDLMSERDG